MKSVYRSKWLAVVLVYRIILLIIIILLLWKYFNILSLEYVERSCAKFSCNISLESVESINLCTNFLQHIIQRKFCRLLHIRRQSKCVELKGAECNDLLYSCAVYEYS